MTSKLGGTRKAQSAAQMGGLLERIIYNEIVVMPEPKEAPSVDELEEDEDEDSQEERNDEDADNSVTITTAEQLEPSIESETFESAVSTPQPSPQSPEPPTQRVRKQKPPPFDPSNYVSSQQEAAEQAAAQAQSHVSYKADTTMWNESAPIEPIYNIL